MRYALMFLAFFGLACHDNDRSTLGPCTFECVDFAGAGPVLPLEVPRTNGLCQPSLNQQADLHLCFDDAGTGGGVNCYYDCPDPMP